MMRFRIGNRHGRGWVPYAFSPTIRPCDRTRSYSCVCRRGYTTSRPVATTPTVRPPASSAPVCAARVDADREAADHSDAGARAAGRHLARVGKPERSRGARADDGDAGRLERVGPIALAQQEARHVGQELGVADRKIVGIAPPGVLRAVHHRSSRNAAARSTSAGRIVSRSSRSARVRATRRTRAAPRPVSWRCVHTSCHAARASPSNGT